MNEEKQAQCGICLEDMSFNTVYTLECRHKFHRSCITSWFQSEIHLHHPLSCPFCRRNCHYPSEDKNNDQNSHNSHNFSYPSLSQEQIKQLLNDGIISIGYLLESDIFSNYPALQNLNTRIRRVLQLPHVKQQINEYLNNPNYSWTKLCLIIVTGVMLDTFCHE